jgi:hypothetical protein
MYQKGRAGILRSLVIGLVALVVTTLAAAQPIGIDFQVIHLSRYPATTEKYTAIRTQEAWAALWSAESQYPNSPPIPVIDFKHFILLIADSGGKPSSGYSTVFASVRAYPESAKGATASVTSVHVVEISPGNCPAMANLSYSIAYALIPQTTNHIRFEVSKADSDCSAPVHPPFIK